jgi:hypothetical protein
LPSLRRKTERLENMAGMAPRFIHCCYNNCMAFTGWRYAEARECSHWRTDISGGTDKPRKTFLYIPLTNCLRLQDRSSSYSPLPSMDHHVDDRVAASLLQAYLDEVSCINDMLMRLNERKDELVICITTTVSHSFETSHALNTTNFSAI